MASDTPDLWVFGYGSLIWNPGFDYVERRKARLMGWTRRLCVWSHVYRGTPAAPGLVFGLGEGGECVGVAYRVEASEREETIDYLRRRELVTNVYHEIEATAELENGDQVVVLTYVVNVAHEQYAGAPSREETLRIVSRSHGKSGANVDYVCNTREELTKLAIVDADLDWLCARLRA